MRRKEREASNNNKKFKVWFLPHLQFCEGGAAATDIDNCLASTELKGKRSQCSSAPFGLKTVFVCVNVCVREKEQERERENCVKWRGQAKTVQNPQPKPNPTPFLVCFALAFVIFQYGKRKRLITSRCFFSFFVDYQIFFITLRVRPPSSSHQQHQKKKGVFHWMQTKMSLPFLTKKRFFNSRIWRHAIIIVCTTITSVIQFYFD